MTYGDTNENRIQIYWSRPLQTELNWPAVILFLFVEKILYPPAVKQSWLVYDIKTNSYGQDRLGG